MKLFKLNLVTVKSFNPVHVCPAEGRRAVNSLTATEMSLGAMVSRDSEL